MNKKIFVLFVAGLFVFSFFNISLVKADLKNTNCGIKPDSLKCINIEMPDDFGAIGTSTAFNVQSDCGEWCDFTSATVFTDPANPVSIPICINTFGKQVNQTTQFKITLSAQGKQREYNYGVCVSNQPDCDEGKGNPCAVVNLNQKYFEIKMNPITPVTANQDSEYEVQVTSPIKLDLELTAVETGKTFSFQIKPNEKMVFRDKVKVSTDTILNVKASVKGCALPGCTKTTSTLLSTKGSGLPSSGNFSISLLPESATSKRGLTSKYYLEIKNYGEEKDYTVSLSLPAGLTSTFNTTTKKIKDKDDIIVEISPTGADCLYTFTLTVRGQVTKTIQGTMSVNEVACDMNRLKTTDVLDSSTINKINAGLISARDSSISDDLKSFSDLMSRTGGDQQGQNTTQPATTTSIKPKSPVSGGGIDMTTILLIIVVVVVAMLFLMFKKRKKMAPREEGYWQ